MFVRKLGKHLLVPLDDDWITLKHYLRLMENNRVWLYEMGPLLVDSAFTALVFLSLSLSQERELTQISKRAFARAGPMVSVL